MGMFLLRVIYFGRFSERREMVCNDKDGHQGEQGEDDAP
jgi:hypothetical protein